MEKRDPIDRGWSTYYRLPSPGNMMESHQHREQVFVNQGTSMANAIVQCIRKYRPNRRLQDLNVLDFGCGVGRVALPLFFNFRKPDHCVDVDPDVISYLRDAIPEATPEVSPFRPPLTFTDGTFDVIYAISVWTHLPEDLARDWLNEIRRVLAPGGLALLSTSNYAVLAQRRAHKKLGPMGWSEISDADLHREGFIFRTTPSPPGTDSYGMASHDPDWIRREWSRYMPLLGIETGAILGMQDINVLENSGQ